MMYESSNMWKLTVVAGSKSPLRVLASTSETKTIGLPEPDTSTVTSRRANINIRRPLGLK